jgi:ligand-binding sensor domain-containing protein/signal transduction histidine kinase
MKPSHPGCQSAARKLLPIFLAVALCAAASAAFGSDKQVQYSSRVWQSEDGLPQNAVQSITQTRDGYLWVGTHEGLARFDGVRFTIFDQMISPELKILSVTALCETHDGALWIGTEGSGLVRLKDGIFTRYTETNELSSDVVRTIFETRDGSLWIGTSGGLDRFQNGGFTHLTAEEGLAHDTIRALCEERDGTLWIGTAVGLSRLKEGRIKTLREQNGLPNNSMKALWLDRRGVLWLGSTAGLSRFENGQFTHFTKEDGLADNVVRVIYEDREGTLWIGSNGGVNRLVNGKFLTELNPVGASFDLVYAITEDREGDIWIGTKGGLNRLNRRRFTTYTKQQGLTHNNIVSVLEDKSGALWIGTWGGGLNKLKDGKFSSYMPKDGLSSDLILALNQGRDESLWIGTDFVSGLNRFKAGKFTRFGKPEVVESAIMVLHEDREANLWIGTRTGLEQFREGRAIARYTVTNGLAGNMVRALCEDHQGNLWIGTSDGLTRCNGGKFTTFTTKDGLSNDTIVSLYEDREQTLWIGTKGGGLNRASKIENPQLSTNNPQRFHFTAYTTKQGLFNDIVYEILDDDKGFLWMSSPKGAFRVAKKELENFVSDRSAPLACQSFGKADGMLSTEGNGVAKPSACKTRDGRIWFATSQGLVSAEPDIQINRLAPPVLIEEIMADKNARPKSKTQSQPELAATVDSVTVPPGRGELEIHYTALSFQAPEKNRFKYKLEGSDSDWIEAGARRVAYYNNLDPGSYRFRVLACNNDGIWNEKGASLALVLQSHYWQTWWFQLGLAAVVSAFLAGIYQAYATRQREIERLRVRIAADLHDEIGSNLASIALLSQMEQSAAPLTARTELGEINRIALLTANGIREIVWFINPGHDTLDEMVTRMTEVAATMLSGVEYQFRGPRQPRATQLSIEFRRNVFLIFKEVLHNIVKHSHATSVQIEVSAERGQFQLRISDNGKGFDETSVRKGNGLKNIRLRAGQLRGQLEIKSQPEAGTVVCFSAKLG